MPDVVRVGIAGAGVSARQLVSQFKQLPEARLVAVADIRSDALEEFRHKWSVETFSSVEEMCCSPDIEVVWVVTPNVLHAEHTIMAAENGKHIICDKPMAVTLQQCEGMIAAVERNKVKFVPGHTKIFDAPVRKMREIVTSGQLGRVIQINTWMYDDWWRRPHLATEVDTALGGGICYRQGLHQVDIVRCIGGGLVRSVRAVAGRRDPNFLGEGDYASFLEFEDGTAATMVLNSYGCFDTTELTWGVGEGGRRVPDLDARRPRPWPAGPVDPGVYYALPELGGAGGESREQQGARRFQPFFGLTVVSCERGDVRQSPEGLYIYTDEGRTEIRWDPDPGGRELQELVAAIREDRPPFPDVRWGTATMEVSLALLESSRERREMPLSRQVPCPL